MSGENIKSALEYAVKLSREQEVLYEINGVDYYDAKEATLIEVESIKYADALKVNTLCGLVEFLKEIFDKENEVTDKLLVHVESPTRVVVLSQLNKERMRESLIEANALLEKFPYGQFQNSERFIINVQSLIQRDLDAEAILNCAASIRIEGGADLEDNGVSQVATAKTGAATVGKAEVPSPAGLRPFRTFLEVEQPESPFIFRINKDGDCALFEADGGIWKNTAMASIKEYLENELKDEIKEGYVSVIA